MVSIFQRFSAQQTSFSRRMCVAALVFAFAISMSGCRNNHDSDSYPAAVSIINGVDDSGGLSAAVGGKTVFSNVAFGDDSGFYGVQPGAYDVDVQVLRLDHSSGGEPKAHLNIADQRYYTAVAFGPPTAPAHLSIFSTPRLTGDARKTAEKSGKAAVRIFNAADGSGKIDVLVNSIVAFKSVPYGHRSESIPLAALPYEWTVKPAGDSDQPYGSPVTLQLKPGRDYLVVVLGNAIDENLQLKAYEE